MGMKMVELNVLCVFVGKESCIIQVKRYNHQLYCFARYAEADK